MGRYAEILKELEPDTEIKFLERFAYYERAKNRRTASSRRARGHRMGISILKKGVI